MHLPENRKLNLSVAVCANNGRKTALHIGEGWGWGVGEGAEQNKVKLFTLRLVLSLLAEDTLHLLAALASTGGDSLSLSALWIFLFRSWNMSWWRFRVCIIFYTGTLHVNVQGTQHKVPLIRFTCDVSNPNTTIKPIWWMYASREVWTAKRHQRVALHLKKLCRNQRD